MSCSFCIWGKRLRRIFEGKCLSVDQYSFFPTILEPLAHKLCLSAEKRHVLWFKSIHVLFMSSHFIAVESLHIPKMCTNLLYKMKK